MHINQLINPASLENDITDGLIRKQVHPNLPLQIFNYTDRAQCGKKWSKATLQARGLIVDNLGNVIARPFPQFFNWDEPKPKGWKPIDLDAQVVVTDKLDGSLGILYTTSPGKFAIATRGSFASEQALHATKIWNERYQDFAYMIRFDLTYLFEIIYPENRIVVDYDGLDDLVLLGAVEKSTGRVLGPDLFPGWPGPKAAVYPYKTLREVVSAKPRAGKEGFVVRDLVTNQMVKVKYEDYVRLHRIVTGLNEKEVWRRTMEADLNRPEGTSIREEVLRDVPDELHSWVLEVSGDLLVQTWDLQNTAARNFTRLLPEGVFPGRDLRKHFAHAIKDMDKGLQKVLWILYDGKSPDDFIWSLVEPKGNKTR